MIRSFPYPHECLVCPTLLSTARNPHASCDHVWSSIREEVKPCWRLCLSVHIQAHVVKQNCKPGRTVVSTHQGAGMGTVTCHTGNTSRSFIRLFFTQLNWYQKNKNTPSKTVFNKIKNDLLKSFQVFIINIFTYLLKPFTYKNVKNRLSKSLLITQAFGHICLHSTW